jgi:chemotaxis protein MotB
MAKAASGDQRPIIIIKKKKKVEGGHHGGAWKVAYADFVTAMMAFFLLLWLLNVTTKEQKLGIAEYFAPTSVSESSSGAGGVMGGQSMVSPGAQDDPLAPITAVQPVPPTGETGEGGTQGEEGAPDANAKEIAKEVMEAIEDNPDLAEMKENIRVDETPEGVRIQIVDTDGRSMFPSGSAKMYEWTQALLKEVAAVIAPLPNAVSIRGHTDGAPFRGLGGYNNWDLSTDRANASRQVLANSGLDQARLANVTGKADRDHFLPADPLNPQNRRISIVLLKDAVAKAQGWRRDPAAPRTAPAPAPAATPAAAPRGSGPTNIDGRGAQAPLSSGN